MQTAHLIELNMFILSYLGNFTCKRMANEYICTIFRCMFSCMNVLKIEVWQAFFSGLLTV